MQLPVNHASQKENKDAYFFYFPDIPDVLSENDNAGSAHFTKSLEISPTASNAEEFMVHLKLNFNFILTLL